MKVTDLQKNRAAHTSTIHMLTKSIELIVYRHSSGGGNCYHRLTLARSQSAGKSSVRRQSPISSPARWARSGPSENQKLYIQEWTSVNLSIYASYLTTKCLHSKAPQPRTVTDLWRQRSHTQTVTTTHIKDMGVFANILRWYDQSP